MAVCIRKEGTELQWTAKDLSISLMKILYLFSLQIFYLFCKNNSKNLCLSITATAKISLSFCIDFFFYLWEQWKIFWEIFHCMSRCSFGWGGTKSHVTIPHSMLVLSTQDTLSDHPLIHLLVIPFFSHFLLYLKYISLKGGWQKYAGFQPKYTSFSTGNIFPENVCIDLSFPYCITPPLLSKRFFT